MTVFNDDAVGALEFSIKWKKDGVHHEEWFLGRKFNAVNDIFPRGMREALEGKGEGDSVTLTYEPRYCIPRHKASNVLELPLDRLRKKSVLGRDIIPRLGRFYPQGHINGLLDIYPDTLTPFRLIGLTDTHFTADRNHPLATVPITITVTIQYAEERDTSTYGSLTHWRETTCDWGPGMQMMHDKHPTDFFQDGFFDQQSAPTESFTPPAPDAKALANLKELCGRHITPDMQVLDFSHGTMADGEYDAAICLLGIEYLANPLAMFQDVSDKIRPGSPVAVGFSNHYNASHVIDGWTQLHEFERSGLVLEYLRQAGLDAKAQSYSMRNDWRDKSDPLFVETKGVSAPVFVVVGHKR